MTLIADNRATLLAVRGVFMAEQRVSVTIAERVHMELKIASARRRMSMQDLLGEAVEFYLSIPANRLDEAKMILQKQRRQPTDEG